MQFKRGFVAGSFDLIHPGYIKLFSYTKKYCSKLIIGLHSNPSLERENKHKPIHTINERKQILFSIKYIDEIKVYKTEKDLYKILKFHNLDIRFLDQKYKGLDFTGKDLPIPIKWVPRRHNYSTTKLIKSIKKI